MWKEKFNNISKQNKSDYSTISAKEWNQIINVLREQSNNNTEGIVERNKLFNNDVYYTKKEILELIELTDKDFFTKEQINELISYLTNVTIGEYDITQVSHEEPTNPLVKLWYYVEEED